MEAAATAGPGLITASLTAWTMSPQSRGDENATNKCLRRIT
jgi:hypothetical protein